MRMTTKITKKINRVTDTIEVLRSLFVAIICKAFVIGTFPNQFLRKTIQKIILNNLDQDSITYSRTVCGFLVGWQYYVQEIFY